MQPNIVQVCDFIFAAWSVSDACFEDPVKWRIDCNGCIKIVNKISSCQLK